MSDDVFTQTNTPVPDTDAAPTREWKPMPDTFAAVEDKKKTFGHEADGLREAAAEVDKARATRPPPGTDEDGLLTRTYQYLQGERAGEAVASNQTVTAERAARDLEMMRQHEASLQQPPTAETAAAIDAFRNELSTNPQTQPAQPEAQPQQQATEAPPTTEQPQQLPHDGIDPELAEALSRPKVRAALEETVAQVEQSRAQYAQAARQAAQITAAALLSQHPEIANLSAQELPFALSALAKTNPEKAQQIEAQLSRAKSLYDASQQAVAAQQQLEQQNLAAWTKAESDKFDREIYAKESPESLQRIKAALPEIIEKDYGISREALSQAWQHNPALRSSAMQSVMLDAVKYRMAQREITTKLDRSTPPVMRPGVAGNHARDSDVETAMAQFRSDPTPKTASRLLIARRAAKGN